MAKATGLKYCGGCCPHFDRVATVKWIQDSLEGLIQLVPYSTPDLESTLIVAGCPVACVDQTPFAGQRILVVKSPEEAERLVRELLAEARTKP